jgi:hypothetical protein
MNVYLKENAMQEILALIANLAAVVRVQNGNLHADINTLLAHADKVISDETRKTSRPDAAVEAINFALTGDEGMEFLRCWQHGDFDAIRKEWPECPNSVFIGADSLACEECGTRHTPGSNALCKY